MFRRLTARRWVPLFGLVFFWLVEILAIIVCPSKLRRRPSGSRDLLLVYKGCGCDSHASVGVLLVSFGQGVSCSAHNPKTHSFVFVFFIPLVLWLHDQQGGALSFRFVPATKAAPPAAEPAQRHRPYRFLSAALSIVLFFTFVLF